MKYVRMIEVRAMRDKQVSIHSVLGGWTSRSIGTQGIGAHDNVSHQFHHHHHACLLHHHHHPHQGEGGGRGEEGEGGEGEGGEEEGRGEVVGQGLGSKDS